MKQQRKCIAQQDTILTLDRLTEAACFNVLSMDRVTNFGGCRN